MQTINILGQDETLNYIKLAGKNNLTALLIGETGTGKTSMIEQIAQEQNQEYARFNLTGETTVEDFVGKYTLVGNNTVWTDGVLLQAMKAGKWLIVDEINAALPEILFTLHSLLDHDKQLLVANHDGEVVKAAEGFRFFATMNPVQDYAGTKDLNRAFLSRFNLVLNVEYPDSATELQILLSHEPELTETDALKLVNFSRLAREGRSAGQLFYACSTRDLINCAKLTVSAKIPLQKAFNASILNKAATDERPAIIEILKTVDEDFKNLKATPKSKKAITPEEIKKEYEQLQKDKAAFEQKKKTLKEDMLKEILKSCDV